MHMGSRVGVNILMCKNKWRESSIDEFEACF